MNSVYTMPISTLQNIDSLIHALGGDAKQILADFDININELLSDDVRIPVSQLVLLFECCAKKLKHQDFGLLLSEHQDFTTLGVLGLVLQHCKTLRQGLDAAKSYIAFHSQAEYWNYEESGRYVIIKRIDNFYSVAQATQYKEHSIALCYQFCRRLLGTKFKCQLVSFSHQPNNELKRYQQFFKSEVIFNQEEDQIWLDKSSLDLPIHATNKQAMDYAISLLIGEQAKYINDVELQVNLLIQQTLATQEHQFSHIAELLNINPRTLQRKLKQQGLVYKAMVAQIRMNAACWYLQSSNIDQTSLASRLGYNDSANFSRAFKRHFALSPSKWRRLHQLN